MTSVRENSSPSLLPSPHPQDLVMEGVAANVKLLLKVIEDYKNSPKGSDGRKPQRVAGMIGILEDIKSRLGKSQASSYSTSSTRRAAQLRRCNTDLRRSSPAAAPAPSSTSTSTSSSGSPKRRVVEPAVMEENEKLRKELAASHATCKSLERMFSSLGKEKEIMAAELARKAYELQETEELLNDLRVQNEMLSEKVKKLGAMEHQGDRLTIITTSDADSSTIPNDHYCDEVEELKKRNEDLGQKVLESLDVYRALKSRFHEGNTRLHLR